MLLTFMFFNFSLGEYVYFSLGGNRSRTTLRRSSNVMTTMALSGLWHGASANFILWGIYHGVMILLARSISKLIPTAFQRTRLAHILGVAITFLLMIYGWLYFRITEFDQILIYNHALLTVWDGFPAALALLAQGGIFLIFWILVDSLEPYWLDIHAQDIRPRMGLSLYIAGMFFLVLILHAEDPSAFIYFRF